MYCENCGSKIKEGEKFCPNCGYSALFEKEKGKKLSLRRKKNIRVFFPIVIILIIITGSLVSIKVIYPCVKYKMAEKFLAQHDYEKAREYFSSLGSYKDAKERVEKFIFRVKTAETEDKRYTYNYEFDENNNIVKMVTNDGSETVDTETYEYDQDNLLVSKKKLQTLLGEKVGQEEEYSYQYDDNHNLVQFIQILRDEEDIVPEHRTTYQYEYGENGERTREVYTYKGGKKLTYENLYQYNDRGLLSKRVEKEEGEEFLWEEYEYDIDGNLVRIWSAWQHRGREIFYTEWIYEYEDNIVKSSREIAYKVNNAEEIDREITTTYEYDDEQRLVKIIKEPGTNKTVTIYTLDSYGNPIEIEKSLNGGEEKEYCKLTYVLTGYEEENYHRNPQEFGEYIAEKSSPSMKWNEYLKYLSSRYQESL